MVFQYFGSFIYISINCIFVFFTRKTHFIKTKNRLFFYDKLLSYCIPKNREVEESEPFAEQPLFFEMKSYTLDENTIKAMPYEDLRRLILESEIFMESKQGKDYILNLKSQLDINVVAQGKKNT